MHHERHRRTVARHERAAVHVRTVLYTVAALLLVGAASALGDVELLDVAPLAAACSVEDGERSCLLLRSSDGGPWRVSEGVVAGFEPRTGYGYRLLVGIDAAGARTLRAVLEEVPLGDVRWRIETVTLGGQPVDLGSADAWLRLDASGARVRGSSGCNAFFGDAHAVGRGRLVFGPLAGTLMACLEPLMRSELALRTVLEGVYEFDQDGDALRLSGVAGAARLSPELPREATTAVRSWGDPGLERFDETVGAAAAAGDAWPYDPLLVALALTEPWDVAQLDVARRDVEPEGARISVVSVEARGLLDDSVAGLRRVVTLERLTDGRWRVIAETNAVRCARGDALWIAATALCP